MTTTETSREMVAQKPAGAMKLSFMERLRVAVEQPSGQLGQLRG